MVITDRVLAKEISAALLEGKSVGFISDFGHPCPAGLTGDPAELGVWVTYRKEKGPFSRTLRLAPRGLILGIGCRRGTPMETIRGAVEEALSGYECQAVAQVATIDLKQDEPGLLAFCSTHHLPLTVFSAAELEQAQGTFTPSAFVAHITGVDNVCERAAVLAGGTILVPKQAKNGVTVAVAGRKIL